MPELRSYIGFGSNLDDPVRQIQQALVALAQLPGCRLLEQSCLYRSRPMGPADQPDYVNAVAALATSLEAHDLLSALQDIEQAQGRVRGEHWGARSLDLDLLLYGDQMINTRRLTVPHAGLTQRDFVLRPLAEIAPDNVIPGQPGIAQLLEKCDSHGLQRIETGA